MREAIFIKQNTERWRRYENIPTTNPDELAERFIAITDDLAYAKTFYPQSKTTQYLNKLAGGFHQSIYKNKKEQSSRIVRYWATELPLLFSKHRWQLLYSFIFFMVFFAIGLLSARYDHDFVNLILGSDYVNMTNDNIAKGDPFGVYKSRDSFTMFWQIVQNNLYITVVNYLMGLFVGIGTLYILFQNGLMLGAFEYLFISHNLGLQSLLVVWIHGTLEISSIIIAGGAGLVLGNSIIFPKTFKRSVSARLGAMDGMKITLGVLPIVVIAATLESFVTRHTEMPVWLSLFILIASAAFIVWYVIIYPMQLSRKLIKPQPNTNAAQS